MAFSQHRMDVIQSMTAGAHDLVKIKKARVSSITDATETDTGIVLPAKCMVLDAFIDVITIDAAETILLGTDGDASDDPNGFGNLLSLAVVGIIRGQAVLTVGSSETYFSSNTRGALLGTFLAGTDAATDVGTYQEFPDVTSGGESVTYTSSSGSDTGVFDVYVVYIEM